VHVFPNLSNRLAYRQLFIPVGLGRYLREHVRNFDVAHLHAFRNVPGTLAARALRQAGVPYIVAPNGTAARIERRIASKRLYDVLIGARVLANASRVLAVTDVESVQLEAIGVRPDRIRVIGNPLDLDEFRRPPSGQSVRLRLGVGGAPLVVFLGKLTPRKRADVVVRAFAELDVPGVRLLIAGNDMGSGLEVRRLVRSLGLESRVHFTGLLAGRDRLDALAAADVVVYPSADEIFGLVPVEALLCGRPVIVASDSGCAEVLRDVEGTRTVPVGDVRALSVALTEGLASSTWRAAAVSGGKRLASRYESLHIARQVDELYAEITLGPRPSGAHA
jgi:glycosyltransferase involved in cell wall biosynthesis